MKIQVQLTLYIRKTAAYTEAIPEWVRVRQPENGGITVTENKTLCIACKYKFHDRALQPCADCLRSTQLVQQGVDRYQRAAQPQQLPAVPETRKAHPAANTLCFACKYMYCDWDTEPCLTCLRHTLAEAGQADAFEPEHTGKDSVL